MRIDPFRALRPPARAATEIPRRLWLDSQPEVDRRAAARSDPRHTAHLFEAANPGALLGRWRDEGALVLEDAPALWLLEVQSADGQRRLPVRILLGAATVGPELTELEEAPRSIPGAAAVPLLAGDDQGVLRALLQTAAERTPAEWEARVEGQLARLWRISDPALTRRLRDTLDEAPVRALRALPERGRVLCAVVALSEPGLRLRPFHRALQQIPTFREETFLTLVQGYARVVDLELPLGTSQGREEAAERLAMLASGYHAVLFVQPGGRGRILRFRQGLELSHIKAAPRNPTLRSLDLALLNALVLRTVIGVPEPEAPGSGQVFTVTSLEELVGQVDRGLFQAGFGLNPPPLWEVRAVIEAQQKLPPRTFAIDPPIPQGLLFLGPET